MSSVFVCSDLHFFHSGVLRFCPQERPFKTVEQMNEALINNWNNTVTKRDTIWVLGDVSFAYWNKTAEILDQLHGNKNLVLGNHDLNNATTQQWLTKFRNVTSMKTMDGSILTHIPIHPSQFFRWRTNVHGHLHNDIVRDADGKRDERYINVSVEHTGLKPIAWEELKKLNPRMAEQPPPRPAERK